MSNPKKQKAIHLKLREARINSELSQLQAAEFVGISRSAITRKELGNRRFSAEELILLANLYKVSLDKLASE